MFLFGIANECLAANTENPYSSAYDHPYRHGVIPTQQTWKKMQQWNRQNSAAIAGPLSYAGGINGVGVVSGMPRVYLVLYGTQWGGQATDADGNLTVSNDTVGAIPYLQNLFKGIATGGELFRSMVCHGGSACAVRSTFHGESPSPK